jgi:hypothetical protein
MIECVFTIDYEIYGSGEGALRELVYDPAEQLIALFHKWDARFVPFVEVAEFERIENEGSDPYIAPVKQQIRQFHEEGFEPGLHLHPQWYNARYENNCWLLDYSEYNLCVLPKDKITQTVERAISYLQTIIEDPEFIPVSYRAGNWLLQPTRNIAEVLAQKGIKVDSSVFKGGLEQQYSLDYRGSLTNGYYWKFLDDVNEPDPGGRLLEVPIHTQMVPFWQMLTSKRVNMQRKATALSRAKTGRLHRIRDYARLTYPLKFDFCRMTREELERMLDKEVQEDQKDPSQYRPLVLIGHTKDLVDFDAVDFFLSSLRQKKIPIVTFASVYERCTA